MKAVAYALQEHPNLNATYEDGVIRVYEDINLSFAVALEDGLITPVIRNVDKKGVREISAEAAELAAKAREGTLEAKDLQDGTFTVTNLGMYGIEVSTPIINPPQVGILAVGSIQPYLVLEEDTVVQRYKLQLSLTVDHRIIDGAPGAEFLQTVAKYLETPYRLLG
jgi:pyruvate dehydrogenase E2 component (dihydrolipoamide acetyltransferase)